MDSRTADDSCSEGCAQLDDFNWFLPADDRVGDLPTPESEMDVSDMYLNLDALSSSSEEESQDLTKRSDLSVTLTCSSEEADTHVNSDEVFSDEDFPAVFGARDIRQVRWRASPPGGQTIGAAQDDRQHEPPAPVVDLVTGKCKPGKVSRTVSRTGQVQDSFAVFRARDIRQVRWRASPPGGQTMGAAQDDRQYEPPASVVDLMTGKCKPGKVSRTVSTSPFTLDLTVMCTSGVKVPMPGASIQVVLPPATVASSVTAIGTSMPFVATPAPVVEQSGVYAREFLTLRLSESPELLPPFGLSSSSPLLPWGATEDSSPPFLPNRVQVGTLRMFQTRAVCSMCRRFHQDSSFGLLEGASRLQPEGSYCRRRWRTLMIRFWVIRSPMHGVKSFQGQNPHCRCWCMRGRQVRPLCWILQYFRLCWLRGPPHCRRRGPRPLPLLWTRGRAGY